LGQKAGALSGLAAFCLCPDRLSCSRVIRIGSKTALTRFVTRYDARLGAAVFVPSIQGKTPYRRIFELQVRQLARVITGDHETYQPFQLQ
jgi:CRISPR/Cas system-associated endonuclease Cas1